MTDMCKKCGRNIKIRVIKGKSERICEGCNNLEKYCICQKI